MVAGKNSKNLKQTKLATQLRVRTPDVSSKSRFVPCPVCGAEVLEPLINEHLDKSCLAQQRREDTKASAAVSKAQQSGVNHSTHTIICTAHKLSECWVAQLACELHSDLLQVGGSKDQAPLKMWLQQGFAAKKTNSS